MLVFPYLCVEIINPGGFSYCLQILGELKETAAIQRKLWWHIFPHSFLPNHIAALVKSWVACTSHVGWFSLHSESSDVLHQGNVNIERNNVTVGWATFIKCAGIRTLIIASYCASITIVNGNENTDGFIRTSSGEGGNNCYGCIVGVKMDAIQGPKSCQAYYLNQDSA